MISLHGLDIQRFNNSGDENNRWMSSFVRTWLNEYFRNLAFSVDEKAMLTENADGDKVWLLSADEARGYFADNGSRTATPTAYAKEKGAWTSATGTGWWWLRAFTDDPDSLACVVKADGTINVIETDSAMVRPVITVNLDPGASAEEAATAVTALKAGTQCAVGDIVTFGNYQKEPIEWQVLEVNGNQAVLIALHGVDSQWFNRNSVDGNDWSTSFIRTWLNEYFRNLAFSVDEKAMIVENAEGDNVWLLSAEEARRYFADNTARIATATAYTAEKGAWTNGSGAGWWWLREFSGGSDRVAGVIGADGAVSITGMDVSRKDIMVRPVIIVEFE